MINYNLSLRARAALAVWGLGVIVVVRAAFEVLAVSSTEFAVFTAAVVIGSFDGVFMPLWRRFPQEWRRG